MRGIILVKVRGFEIPKHLYYDVKNHIWVGLVNKDIVKLGLDDVGQFLAKKILFIRIKPAGSKVKKGSPVAMLESAKWVGPVISPVTGTVIEINDKLRRKPSLINDDPYGDGWIAKIKLEKPEELKELVTGEEALKKQEEDIIERGISR